MLMQETAPNREGNKEKKISNISGKQVCLGVARQSIQG